MKNLYKIKEQYFCTQSNNSLLEQMQSSICNKTTIDTESYPYAYAIYIDGDDRKTIIDSLLSTDRANFDRLGFSNKFRNFINRNKPKDFNDLLFLIDIYNCDKKYFPRVSYKDIQSVTFTKVSIVDVLLKESKGFLLWRHQLENLYRVFNNRQEEVESFCTGIRLKRIKTWDIAKGLKFDNGLSLKEVLTERMVLKIIKTPNIAGAMKLNNLLFG